MKKFSYAAGITLSVGCLLLILNMLIFAAIYYQRQVHSTNAAKQHSIELQQQTPDLMQPTTSIPSYYIADCDSLDLSKIEKCINKTRELERSNSERLKASVEQVELPVERVEVPQITGILLKHGPDDGRGTLKPKKRVQIQTDVSIV